MTDVAARIRPYLAGDAPAFHSAVLESVEHLQPWMPWCHPGYTLVEAEAWVSAQVQAFAIGQAYEFVMTDGAGEILGGCGLNQFDPANQRANLGYWVRASAAGRGLGTASVRLLVQWAAAHTAFQRLEVVVATGNPASVRVAEKAGAVREGILRNRLLLRGGFSDAVLLAFIRGQNMEAVESSARER